MSGETPEKGTGDEFFDEPQSDVHQAGSTDAGGQTESEADPLTLAQQERDKFRDQFLRTAAEMENFRKRAAREREESLKYASFGLLCDLLPAMDNLRRAVDAGASEEQSGNLLQGVQMVLKQFEEILTRHGAEPISAMGEPFDPNVHEALQQVPSNDVPPLTVVRELERGFRFHDRVLRPSKVIVSSQADES